jgi:hypothetical protein
MNSELKYGNVEEGLCIYPFQKLATEVIIFNLDKGLLLRMNRDNISAHIQELLFYLKHYI